MQKPKRKSIFPNSVKDYDSKERASLEPVLKENQKQLESLRGNIIKQTEDAQRELKSAEDEYNKISQNLKETQTKISSLVDLRDQTTDAKTYSEAKASLEEEFKRRESLREELKEPARIAAEAREKIRNIGLNAIRQDMQSINAQDGFSTEQLNNATTRLRQEQEKAIADDQKSMSYSKDEGAIKAREQAQEKLRTIFNPHIHSASLSKPVHYTDRGRAHSMGEVIQFPDGSKVSSLTGIAINKQSTTSTILHEYGHQVEAGNPEAHDLCSDFLKKRTSGEKIQKFQKVFRGYGFSKDEKGSPDDFEKSFKAVFPEIDSKRKAYYAGKVYDESPFGTSSKYLSQTEVYSMGLELLHENPVAFAKADPEWFDLVSGIATGRLLKKTRGAK